MKKMLAAGAITVLALVGVAPAANAAEGGGNAYGAVVQRCLGKSVGAAIQAGRVAHPGVTMTAKSIAQSPHCAL